MPPSFLRKAKTPRKFGQKLWEKFTQNVEEHQKVCTFRAELENCGENPPKNAV
jgi:hypothetical protein